MKIHITKELQPVVVPLVSGIKTMQEYDINNYKYKDFELEAPSQDINLEDVITISRVGAQVDAYEIWFEIPDAQIDASVTEGVSFSTYLDEDASTIWRTWADTALYADGSTNTLRYWQPSNNGTFNWNDVELIQEDSITVYGKKGLFVRRNEAEYADTEDPEYEVLETIPYIDQNWRYGYFDMVHAHIRMSEIYTDLGPTDASRWAASTAQEQEILVRWNLVGLNRAATLVDSSWSEGRQLKEIGRKYREFNINMILALVKRFNDWYEYLNMILSGTGDTKFANDWAWELKDAYIHRFLRQFELGVTNDLVDFNNTTLGTYLDSDFIGTTITAAQFVSGLEKVLVNKEYFI